MKIAYFGSDVFYPCFDYLIRQGHEIISLYTNKHVLEEHNPSKNVCIQAGLLKIPVHFNKPTRKDIDYLISNGCEMIISAGYGYRIPEWAGIKYACNIHLSLLPLGAGPIQLPYIIVKGLEKTGVTIHKIAHDWDTGEILLQESFSLYGIESIEEIYCKKKVLAVTMLAKFLDNSDTYWLNSHPQDLSQREYWPLPDPQQFQVNFNDDLETINRNLRAHRYVDADGNIEYINSVSTWVQDHNHVPGTILSNENSIQIIAAKGGAVCFKINKKIPDQINFVTE